MPAPTFERYWMDPSVSRWNMDNSTWLTLDRLDRGDFESSQDCTMSLQASGEIWEFCHDAEKSLGGNVPFVISKYRPLRA